MALPHETQDSSMTNLCACNVLRLCLVTLCESFLSVLNIHPYPLTAAEKVREVGAEAEVSAPPLFKSAL